MFISVAADGPSVIQEAVEPAVINVNEEEGCMISEDAPVTDKNEDEKTTVTEDEIGFKKIVKFFELKFTVTKDKGEEKKTEEEGSKPDDSNETSPTTTDQDAEGKSEEEPVCVDLTADSAAVEPLSKPADEAAVQQTSDTSAPNEEVSPTEGLSDVQEQTSPEEGEEDLSPIKKFFSTGIFSGLKKKKKEEPIKEEVAGEELQTIEKEETEKVEEQEAAEPAQEKKVEDVPAGTNEGELLGSQEKPKVEGSPLKRLFSRLSTRRLIKVPEPSETTAEEQAKTDASKKEETPVSSPEDKSKDESKHESDGEGVSDGERRRPWSSFRKLVTPKRQRPKAESEEVTEKTSTDIPSPETQDEVKPSEEPEQTEPSLEEPKKKSDLSVSWEALICGGSTKKRSRKGSNSEDEVAVEKDSRPEDDQGKTAESPLGSSLEGDDEHVSSSLEQSGSPPEGDGASTWKSLKKLVTPKRKLRVGESGEQIPSDGETPKDETSFSVKKLISGRKKRRSDGKQEQTSSDEASKDVGSEDEDDETPSVVPLSEFDVIEPSMVHTIPKGEEPADSTQETEEKPLPPGNDLGTPIVATVPKDFEDLTDYITKHQPLSDIPEESVVSPACEEAFQDDTIAEDIVEWTSEAFTAAEPPTEVSFVTAVSHLSESPKSSGASTPVASEGDIKDTDVVLQEAVETVSIISSNLSVTDNEKIVEVAAMSLTPQLLGTSITEETKILTAHEKFEATNICIGLLTEDIGVVEEMPPMTTIEAPPEVSEALPTECASGEDLAMEPEAAGIAEDELHEAEVKETITEVHEVGLGLEEAKEAEADQAINEEEGEEMSYVLENQQETELVNGLEELVPIHVAITSAVQGEAQYLEGQVIAEDTPRPTMEGPMDSAIEGAVCVEPAILAEVTVAGEKEQEISAIETKDADILHGTLAELAESETCQVVSSTLGIPTGESTELSEALIPVVAPTVQSAELQESADVVEPVLDSVTSVVLTPMTEEVTMENVHAVCSDDHEIQVEVQDAELQSVEPVEESTLEVVSADEVTVKDVTELEVVEKKETEPAEEVAPLTAPEIIQHVEVEDLSAIGDESASPEDALLQSEKAPEDNQAASQGDVGTDSITPQAIEESVEKEEKATSELGLGLPEGEAQADAVEAEKQPVEFVMETHEPVPSIPSEPTVYESTAETALLTAVEVQTSSLIEPELDTPVAALQTETSEVTALEVEAPVITEPEVEIASVTSPEEAITETAQETQAPTLAAELVVGTTAVTELEAETPVAPVPEVETPVVTALEVKTSVASEPELEITEVQEMKKETPVVSAVEVEAPVQSALEMETNVNTKMAEEAATVATMGVEQSIESELAVETIQQSALEKETAITVAPEKEIAVAAIPEVETAIVQTSVAPKLEETTEVMSTPEEVAAQTMAAPEVSTEVAVTPEVTTEVAVAPEVVAEVASVPVASAEIVSAPEVSPGVSAAPDVTVQVAAVPVVSAEVADAPEVAAPPVVITEVTPAQAIIAEVTPAPVVMTDISCSPVLSTEVANTPEITAAPAVIPEVAPVVQAAVVALPELQSQTTVVDAPEVKSMVANALVVETPSVVVPEVQVDPAVIVSSLQSEVVTPPKVETATVTTPEVRAMAAVQTEKPIVEATPLAPIAPVATVSPVNVTVTIHVTSTIAKSESEAPKVDATVSAPVVAAPVVPTPAPVVVAPAPVVAAPVAPSPVVAAAVPVVAAPVASAPVVVAPFAPAPVVDVPAPVSIVAEPITPTPIVTAPVIASPTPVESTPFVHVPIMATSEIPAPVMAATVAAPIAPVVAAPAPVVAATLAPAPVVSPPIIAAPTIVEAAPFAPAPVIAAPAPVAAAPIAPVVPSPVGPAPVVAAPPAPIAQKSAVMVHIPIQVTIPKTKADTPETEDDVWEDAVDDMAPKVEVAQPIASPPIVTVEYVYPQAEYSSDPIQSVVEGSVTQEVQPKEDLASLKPEEGPAAELQTSSEFEFQDAAENSDSTLNGT